MLQPTLQGCQEPFHRAVLAGPILLQLTAAHFQKAGVPVQLTDSLVGGARQVLPVCGCVCGAVLERGVQRTFENVVQLFGQAVNYVARHAKQLGMASECSLVGRWVRRLPDRQLMSSLQLFPSTGGGLPKALHCALVQHITFKSCFELQQLLFAHRHSELCSGLEGKLPLWRRGSIPQCSTGQANRQWLMITVAPYCRHRALRWPPAASRQGGQADQYIVNPAPHGLPSRHLLPVGGFTGRRIVVRQPGSRRQLQL